MLEMGLAKIYPYTEFEVSSFIHSRFTEEDLKFKNWPLDPDHAAFGTWGYFVMLEMGLFEVSVYRI